jgi:hypothetical protein
VRVNGWTPEKAAQHLEEAFVVWEQRSRFNWTLDISVVQPGSSSGKKG